MCCLYVLYRLHGVAASDKGSYFHGHANKMYPELGMGSLKSEDLCHILEEHKGKGYGLSTQEELGQYC